LKEKSKRRFAAEDNGQSRRNRAHPANAPHQFHNVSDKPARLLCICGPAGQEEFFEQIGVPVATRTTTPPQLDEAAQAAFIQKAQLLARQYRSELLKPAG
jgi:uncharacterized cupin superfamily protein